MTKGQGGDASLSCGKGEWSPDTRARYEKAQAERLLAIKEGRVHAVTIRDENTGEQRTLNTSLSVREIVSILPKVRLGVFFGEGPGEDLCFTQGEAAEALIAKLRVGKRPPAKT